MAIGGHLRESIVSITDRSGHCDIQQFTFVPYLNLFILKRIFIRVIMYSDHATGWATGVIFPAGAGILFVRHRVQTGSGAHPASYPLCIRGSNSGWVMWPGRDANQSLPSGAESSWRDA
jgi:hypothetical protein